MAQSTASGNGRKSGTLKPDKPYAEYPLTPHGSGHWCKKIRGKLHYFGRWGKRVNGTMQRVPNDGWKEALEEYKRQADDLHAGRTPRPETDGLTVAQLGNHFLSAKKRQLLAGDIAARTYADYDRSMDRIVAVFGKMRLVSDLAANDFEKLRADIAKNRGPVALGNEVGRCRVVFNYAYKAGLIDGPIRLTTFTKPTKKTLRIHRAKSGKRLFDKAEIRAMLKKASPQLNAMILLGINCGFGNHDCATLPIDAVDLQGGWIDYARPKTGIERRCPLWPETINALQAVLAKRKEPNDENVAGLLFVTKYGQPWATGTSSNPISAETRKLLQKLQAYRKGLGFYALRHTFRTIADGTRDFPAVRHIMGHADESMDAVYREHIDDERLRAVADHVHTWALG